MTKISSIEFLEMAGNANNLNPLVAFPARNKILSWVSNKDNFENPADYFQALYLADIFRD
jgi:hypothetical protein